MTVDADISIDLIVDRVRNACGRPDHPVLLHGPCLKGREIEYLADCIKTEWVSTGGAFVTEFEKKLEKFTGARHAIAAVNGTCALHIALILAGVEAEDEILTTALTFVASSNAISYCGAIPHFCDIEASTLGLDPERLDARLHSIAVPRGKYAVNRETGRRIRAILPVHALGHPVRMDELLAVANKWNLPVIEDAAESIGSYYKGRHTGTMGRLGVLSFNSNKIVTTGGGGAILTNDSELAHRAKHLSTTAKTPHPWEFIHDEIGFNYRLPNINAAVGCAQLERLPGFLVRKRLLAKRYMKEFQGVSGLEIFVETPECRSNYWLNALVLDAPDVELRDSILGSLNAVGLQSRPIWRPMHQLDIYSRCPRADLSVTENVALRIINVPSGPAIIAP